MRRTDTKSKKNCGCCSTRRALYRYRGRTRWSSQHDLCFRCWRSIMDRLLAARFSHLGGKTRVAPARVKGVSESSPSEVFELSA